MSAWDALAGFLTAIILMLATRIYWAWRQGKLTTYTGYTPIDRSKGSDYYFGYQDGLWEGEQKGRRRK